MDDKRYVFSANSVHELHALAKKLYLAFSQADKTVIDSRNSWTHSNEIDYSLHPWDYYSCQIGTNECHIHKHRNGTYSIYCNGFKPSLDYYDDTSLDNDFYNHIFGKFLSFDEAKNAFADIVQNLLTYKVKLLIF